MTNYDYDTSRGPWHAMLDRQALAHQAQFGGTYEQAFTKVYTDPSNASIRDQAQYEHLAKSHDVMFGTRRYKRQRRRMIQYKNRPIWLKSAVRGMRNYIP
jgi:hypothetical protein